MINLNTLDELQLKNLLNDFSKNYLSIIYKNNTWDIIDFIEITGIINNQHFEIHFITKNNHNCDFQNIMGVSLVDKENIYYYLPVIGPAATFLNSKELYLKTSFNLYDNYSDILSNNKITLSELK